MGAEHHTCGAARDGSPGQPGDTRSGLPTPTHDPPPQPVRAGLTDVQTYADVPPIPLAPALSWLSAQLTAARLAYLNGASQEAGLRLAWIKRLCDSIEQTGPGYMAQLRLIRAETRILLFRMAQGLDAFGRNFNYVTLRSYDDLKVALTTEMDLAKKVQDHVTALRSTQAAQEARRNAVSEAAAHYASEKDTAEARMREYAQQIGDAENQARELLGQLDVAYQDLQAADAEFQQAVSRSVGGCAFSEVLQFGAMVATVVSTAGAAGAVYGAAGTALSQLSAADKQAKLFDDLSTDGIKSSVKVLVGIAKPVGNSIDQARAAYQSAKSAIAEYRASTQTMENAPALPDDYAKLVASKDEFDHQISRYVGTLPQAAAYKTRMDRFVTLAEARNNKLLQHDALCAELIEAELGLNKAKLALERQVSDFDTQHDASVDTTLAGYQSVLETILLRLAKSLTDLRRAQEYLAAATEPAPIVDFSVDGLTTALAASLTDYDRALDEFGEDVAAARHIAIPLQSLLAYARAADFVAGKPVVICLPSSGSEDPIRDWYAAQIRSITVAPHESHSWWPLHAQPLPFTLKIQSLGRSLVKDREGVGRVFCHATVSANYSPKYDKDSPGTFGDPRDQRYVGASPYGPWLVQLVGSSDAARAVLKGSLVFEIVGRPTPISNRAS